MSGRLPAGDRLQLRVQTGDGFEVLRPVTAFAIALAEQAGLDEVAGYRLRLAVDELATNVVMHAYGPPGGSLLVDAGVEHDRLWVRLTDHGPPFDPTAAPDPLAGPVGLSERQPGGLGIALARRSVDRLEYHRDGDANVVVVVMALHDEEGCT
ncbi:MAG TPA: ATP-binding protein [Jatrophihabitans sp.]|nr:ATP-binding protein [Jatrophihabitans sp.]